MKPWKKVVLIYLWYSTDISVRNVGSVYNLALNFSLNSTNLGIFQTIPNFEDSYSKNNSKKITKFLEKF